MPLYLYHNIYESGSVLEGWKPAKGGSIKYPAQNQSVKKYLRKLLPGKWQKVIKKGNTGEVHYFEHESRQVAGVKFF